MAKRKTPKQDQPPDRWLQGRCLILERQGFTPRRAIEEALHEWRDAAAPIDTTERITITLGSETREVGETFHHVRPAILQTFTVLAKRFDEPNEWHPFGLWWYNVERTTSRPRPGFMFAEKLDGTIYETQREED